MVVVVMVVMAVVVEIIIALGLIQGNNYENNTNSNIGPRKGWHASLFHSLLSQDIRVACIDINQKGTDPAGVSSCTPGKESDTLLAMTAT